MVTHAQPAVLAIDDGLDDLDGLLSRVGGGETVALIRRGKVVAHVAPPRDERVDGEKRQRRLEAADALLRMQPRRDREATDEEIDAWRKAGRA